MSTCCFLVFHVGLQLHVPVVEQEFRMAGGTSTTTTGSPASARMGAAESEPTAESRLTKATSKRSSVKRNSIVSNKRTKRAASSFSPLEFNIRSNHNRTTGRGGSKESLTLRRVVHVVGPDDMPGFEGGTGSGSAAVYGK